MIQIYLITNKLTNEKYVGQTKHDIATRLEQHVRQGIRKGNRLLGKALQWYGLMNFTIEVLDTVVESQSKIVETTYIDKLNTLAPNGYNMRYEVEDCAELILSEEDELIKHHNLANGLQWNVGIEMKKYIGQKVSNSIKKKKESGWSNPSQGHPQSQETKQKISYKKKKYFENNVSHNAVKWKITYSDHIEYTNTLCRDLGSKMYNRITSWSRNNLGLHPKLNMRVDHADIQ